LPEISLKSHRPSGGKELLSSPRILRFGAYMMDLQRCSLHRGGQKLELRPKAFDVLRYLVENPGRVIPKDELIKAIWPGLFVTDDALVQCVKDIRQALAEDAHQIIKTVPRRGYLLSAEPERTPELASATAPLNQSVQFCVSEDGFRLAYACAGEGSPLVRAATWFNHLEYDWQVAHRGALFHFLAERFQLVRYDGRGTGLSDWGVGELSLETFEKDLEAIVDALTLRKYALLGTSQGAATSIAHAVRYPDRVSKMVLHGAYALGRNRRGSIKERESGQAYLTLMRHGWGDEHSAFLKSYALLFFPNASAEQIRSLAEMQRMATSAETAVRLRTACDEIDVLNLLPRVTVPTLVLHSRYDNIVPLEEGRRVAASIPRARFVCLESENHVPLPHEDAWPQFVGEIAAFLSA
jgi:pimeloyl-ACP methyl ester carboxylesterase/DNA-binding winged helix-turn-helix (wHTH) protein